MKKLLLITFLCVVLVSGCTAPPDLKYVDQKNPENYIVFHQQAGTFTVITTEYQASGSYIEEGDYYILTYTGYPGSVSVRKTTAGIEIERGIVWKRAN